MDENQMLVDSSEVVVSEPTNVENSEKGISEQAESLSEVQEGQSLDPSEELILGKFKSVDELSKAYLELQRYQGQSSQELGELRKENSSMNGLKESLEQIVEMQAQMQGLISQDKEKYNSPEYFQDMTFRNLYKEAFMALNGNLDTDKFVNLLEEYVKSRVTNHEKTKSANAETQKVLDSMSYQKNPKTTFTPPKKSFDEMTPKEIDDLIDRLI